MHALLRFVVLRSRLEKHLMNKTTTKNFNFQHIHTSTSNFEWFIEYQGNFHNFLFSLWMRYKNLFCSVSFYVYWLMPFISATFHYSLTLCFLLLSVSPFTDWLLISWLMNEYLFVIFCYLWKCVWFFSRLFVSSYPVCANIFFEIENNFSDFYKWVSLCRAKRDWLTQRLTSNKRENQLLYSLFVYSFVHWYSMWMVESHSEYKDIDPDIRRENNF